MSQKIFVGCMHGEFGHFLTFIMPILNQLKQEGKIIEYAGFSEHERYFQRQYKGSPVDQFYGIEINNRNTSGFINPEQSHCVTELLENKKSILYWPISQMGCSESYEFYCKHGKISRRFIAPKIPQYENSIIIFPRHKCPGRDLNPDIWRGIIKKISQKYTVYTSGHPSLVYRFNDIENCIDISNEPNRIDLQIDILNNCIASINCLGGGSVLSWRCGTPILYFGNSSDSIVVNKDKNPKYHIDINPFDNVFQYIECDSSYNPELAANNVLDFIQKYGHQHSKINEREFGATEFYAY